MIPALTELTTALTGEAQLTPLGQLLLDQLLVEKARNHWLIARELQKVAGSAFAGLPPLLVITGLPRTGSTMLHRLLAQVPGVRTLQHWELTCPAPAPRPQTYRDDPRRGQDRRRQWLGQWLWDPSARARLAAIHSYNEQAPEECVHLLMNTLTTAHFGIFGRIEGYFRWLARQDMRAPYLFYRQQLQLLTMHWPTWPLVVKSPLHLRHLGILLETLPGVRVVQTHRDPLRVVPSICSDVAAHRQLFSDHVSLPALGLEALAQLEENVRQSLPVRQGGRPEQFLDVYYEQLQRDPLEQVHLICRFAGLPYDQTVEASLSNWLCRNPQHKHGVHRYALQDFDLDEPRVLRSLAAYRDYFSLAREKS
jgi:hypothetical protein